MNNAAHRDEFTLIDWIKRQQPDDPRVRLGIGDDAALIDFVDSYNAVVTTDMLMEGTDFTFPPASPFLAGRKSLAVNLSDLAAMGAVPHSAFVSVSLPRRGKTWTEEFFGGLFDLAKEFDIAIAGGDTNSWDGPLVVSITALGTPGPRGVITRSGAQPGDWIFATGEFGGSIAGHHLTFIPRIREALSLTHHVDVHAMIDVSDGLASDLRHLLEASGVGAIVDATHIPISSAAWELSVIDGKTALEHALGDGEDFELVFCVSPSDGQRLLDNPIEEIRYTPIGVITDEAHYLLNNERGETSPMPQLGWVHRV
ncbi:MAG: thiamine-phosphate kinase [Planctomycetota bacterium]|nr:thiamine-phosphate kinase [Planctomycetota bacterium]MDA1212239.1 thiamine-phosphate kinase [Planctomycetota bacterium]